MRKTAAVILVLLLALPLSANLSGWVPSVSVEGGYYGSEVLTGAYDSTVPVRTSGSFTADIGILDFSFEKFKLDCSYVYRAVSRSIPFGGTCLKSFTASGIRAGAGAYLRENLSLCLDAEALWCGSGNDVRFGSLGLSAVMTYTLSSPDYCNINFTARTGVSWRKDILAFGAEVGLEFMLRGFWVKERL